MIKIRLQDTEPDMPLFIMVVAPSTSVVTVDLLKCSVHMIHRPIRVLKNSNSRWIELIIGFKLEHSQQTTKSLIRQGRLSPELARKSKKKTKAKADRKNNKKPALEASAVDQEKPKRRF